MHNDEPRMELRALIAVILSMAVLAAYQYFFVPPPPPEAQLPEVAGAARPEPVATEPGDPGTTEPGSRPQTQALIAGAEAESATPAPELAVGAAEETQVSITAENYLVTLTNRGGRVTAFVLPGFRGDDGNQLDLVGGLAAAAGRLPFEWVSPSQPEQAAALNAALFALEVQGGSGFGNDRTATPESPVVVRFTWADGGGRTASKELVFPATGNVVEVKASAEGLQDLFLGLGAGLDEVPTGLRNAYLSEGALAYGPEGLEKWRAAAIEGPITVQGPQWAGIESHYFMAAYLLDETAPDGARVAISAVDVPVAGAAETTSGAEGAANADGAGAAEPENHTLPAAAVAVAALGAPTPVYFGPKKYDDLVRLGHALQRAVDFGMWGFVSRPLLFVLNAIHSVVRNYGIAIILLTALLRLVFWPLNQKSMTSMRKTQKLQPQMAAIRARYKGAKDMESRQKMNEEVMALYKREGVSPLGGCLPMLAQIPILFSFYALLSVAIELRQAPFFLWVTDLSRHDPYLVLPLMMGGSMLVQQRLTPQATADPQQASMMRMMRLMPIFFTVMFLYVPSGLVLYWLVNNLLGIGQQLYINRSLDRQAEADKLARKAGRAAAKKAKKGDK